MNIYLVILNAKILLENDGYERVKGFILVIKIMPNILKIRNLIYWIGRVHIPHKGYLDYQLYLTFRDTI